MCIIFIPFYFNFVIACSGIWIMYQKSLTRYIFTCFVESLSSSYMWIISQFLIGNIKYLLDKIMYLYIVSWKKGFALQKKKESWINKFKQIKLSWRFVRRNIFLKTILLDFWFETRLQIHGSHYFYFCEWKMYFFVAQKYDMQGLGRTWI